MISYSNISRAINLYEAKGYTRIEVPWWASKWAVSLTAPENAGFYRVTPNDKYLLASGDQAFVYLSMKGQLPPGKYQTVTPCFRNEAYDQYHSKHFLKLELFESFSDPNYDLRDETENTCFTAKEVLETIGEIKLSPMTISQTSVDLCYKDIEVGSYGWRKMGGINWVYGTGIAEPRFSSVVAS